jgi:hypothetical protein
VSGHRIIGVIEPPRGGGRPEMACGPDRNVNGVLRAAAARHQPMCLARPLQTTPDAGQ